MADAFVPGDHATTYGGQPLATAAARATLAVMEAEDVPTRALKAGEAITTVLTGVPGVTGVRGRGLLLGVELAPGIDAKEAASTALTHGLVVNAVTPTTLRLAPSLLVTEDEVAEAVEIISTVLAGLLGGTAESAVAGSDEEGVR